MVIGTAFDPDMDGNLRVTMVATGLQDSRLKVVGAPTKEVKPVIPPKAKVTPADEPEEGDEALSEERPVVPKKRLRVGNGADNAVQTDMDHLDIPAFLRKQAD